MIGQIILDKTKCPGLSSKEMKGEFLKFIRGRVYVRKEKYKIKKRKIL